MCTRGYPRLTVIENCLLSLWILYQFQTPWLADYLFLYLGFKVSELGLFISINLIANRKAQLECLFFLLSSEDIAANLVCDSHSFQLTKQIAYYFFATCVL